MKRYRWHRQDGLLDEDGKQILVMLPTNCTRKFLHMAGKELANKLNTIEQGKEAARRYRQAQGGEG